MCQPGNKKAIKLFVNGGGSNMFLSASPSNVLSLTATPSNWFVQPSSPNQTSHSSDLLCKRRKGFCALPVPGFNSFIVSNSNWRTDFHQVPADILLKVRNEIFSIYLLNQKIKSSLYLRYYVEASNEWGATAPWAGPISAAWRMDITAAKNVTAATVGDTVSDLNGLGTKPWTSGADSGFLTIAPICFFIDVN